MIPSSSIDQDEVQIATDTPAEVRLFEPKALLARGDQIPRDVSLLCELEDIHKNMAAKSI